MKIYTSILALARIQRMVGRPSKILAIAVWGIGIQAWCTPHSCGQSTPLTPVDRPAATSTFNEQTESPFLFDPSDGIDQFLTRLALANLPREFTDDKNWGMQEEKRRTVRLLNQQGRLDPSAPKQMVNHGNWRRYTIVLRNPEEEFQIKLKNIRELPNGNIGFQVFLRGHLDFIGQQANWKRGVRLLKLTAKGHTEVEVELELELGVEFVGKGLLPDVILHPEATDAKLTLTDFRIDRVGKLGGEVAQQVSREAKKRIDEKLPEHETKIVDKVNQEFSKKENGYRFSLSDAKESKFKEAVNKLFESHNKGK